VNTSQHVQERDHDVEDDDCHHHDDKYDVDGLGEDRFHWDETNHQTSGPEDKPGYQQGYDDLNEKRQNYDLLFGRV
jgi:hypothetical protein